MLSLVMKDQELDKILRQIANDTAVDDRATDEIADSPGLWWSVQRDIRNVEPAKAPWPPNILKRLLMISVPAAAAILVGVAFYVSTINRSAPEIAGRSEDSQSQQAIPTGIAITPMPDPASKTSTNIIPPAAVTAKANGTAVKTIRAIHRSRSTALPATQTAATNRSDSTEIKSDFVALAYAQNPESGQLVRVKVPSSMMVSLGVVPTVSDPSKLIYAEVIVGDDGLTHAIRFIRQ